MPTDVNLLKDRNMKNWKTRLWVLIVLLNMGMGISTFAQKIRHSCKYPWLIFVV